MALKISRRLASIIEYLKVPGTTPEMYARLHGIQVSTVREAIRRGRANDFEARNYHATWNGLMSNPRLRRWLKRPEDYTAKDEQSDRRRQILLESRKIRDSRSKRVSSPRRKNHMML